MEDLNNQSTILTQLTFMNTPFNKAEYHSFQMQMEHSPRPHAEYKTSTDIFKRPGITQMFSHCNRTKLKPEKYLEKIPNI